MITRPRLCQSCARFSLRTLLLIIAVACVGFALLGYQARLAQRQKEAIAAIWERGGYVRYDYEYDSDDNRIDSPALPAPAWLCELLGLDFFANVVEAGFWGPPDDAELKHLKTFRRLKWLNLDLVQITDARLVHLDGLNQLERLSLMRAPGPEEVTDAGLMHLRGLKRLKDLDLTGTEVTDAGLPHLQGLCHLERLSLSGTKVTDHGCAELQMALPKLKIER